MRRGLRVTVAWSAPGPAAVASVELPAGATIADAVGALAVTAGAVAFPADVRYAIFGQAAEPDTPLADGDRVEITGPLLVDAKAVRRQKAAGRARPKPPVRRGRRRPR